MSSAASESSEPSGTMRFPDKITQLACRSRLLYGRNIELSNHILRAYRFQSEFGPS